MAALEMFQSFVGSLSDEERRRLQDQIKNERADLSAARSEEARLRIVQKFIATVQRHSGAGKS